ncbi:MAG: hypothetical protein GOP50_08565 [Candidatus Heimdallarchaeota archaeon]|nr:hypothetical protein [Candidatus Heimdallarchaeota archaeon]
MNNSNTYSSDVLYHQPGHLKPVNTIREIGDYIFTGSQDGRVCIWDKGMEKELGCIYAHNASIVDIQGTTDLQFLITSAQELVLKIWFMKDFDLADSERCHISTILGAKAVENHIISASKDLQLKKWEIVENKLKLIAKNRIVSLDKYFADENRLYISSIEGDKIILDAGNFKQIATLFVSDNKVLRSIRKASKYVKEFVKKDPNALLFNISRRNGFLILSFKATSEFIILGHEFGFVSIWNKETLKLIKAFFVHGNHITGIDIHGDYLYSTSLDSTIVKFDIQKQKPIKVVKLTDKPYSLLKSSNNELIVGLGNGDIILFDTNLEIIRKHPGINLITGADITPKNVILAFNSGEIYAINNSNLALSSSKKLHDKPILGVFYYEGNIITVGNDNKILVLDEDLNITKSVEFTQRKSNVRRIRHYIVLTPNHVFDLRNKEVIKGEISSETEKELKDIEAFQVFLIKGDVLLKIQKKILSGEFSLETKNYYSQEILESLHVLAKASEKTHYKYTSEFTVLSDDIINKK